MKAEYGGSRSLVGIATLFLRQRHWLEGDSKPQTCRAAAIDSFLRESRESTGEIRVRIYILQHRPQRRLINSNIESTQVRKTTVREIQVRHPYRVVEDVIEVRTERCCYPLAELEVLVKPEVYSPCSRSPQ